MRKVLLTATFVVALATMATAQKLGPVHTETAGGWSIAPPDGWTFEHNAKKLPVFWGPEIDKLTANLNVGTAQNDMTFEKLRETWIAYAPTHPQNLGVDSTTVESSTAMKAGELKGFRVILVSKKGDQTFRSIQYVLSKDEKKLYVLTFTALNADRVTNDVLFEASAKSFKLLQ